MKFIKAIFGFVVLLLFAIVIGTPVSIWWNLNHPEHKKTGLT